MPYILCIIGHARFKFLIVKSTERILFIIFLNK